MAMLFFGSFFHGCVGLVLFFPLLFVACLLFLSFFFSSRFFIAQVGILSLVVLTFDDICGTVSVPDPTQHMYIDTSYNRSHNTCVLPVSIVDTHWMKGQGTRRNPEHSIDMYPQWRGGSLVPMEAPHCAGPAVG